MDIGSRISRSTLVRGGVTILVTLAVVGVLYLSWQLAGPIATILYAFLFLLGISLLPVTIALLGKSTPNALAKGEFILGQLAFGEGWLVQHEREWQMHPGRERDGVKEVYLDGEWQAVPDTEHQTILGWQPFGILLNKDEETMSDDRIEDEIPVNVDKQTARELRALGVDIDATATDGGEQVTRAGITEVEPPQPTRSHPWILDLKRYWSRGLEQIGDIDVIQKIEEITMRKEAAELNSSTEKRMVIGTIAGLVLGVATGYVVMLGF